MNRDQIIAKAKALDIDLASEDFQGHYLYPEIDGMDAAEWLEMMTLD